MGILDPINFSYNWNNKLNNNYFTTLRKSINYQVGGYYQVMLKKEKISKVEVIKRIKLSYAQLTDVFCFLDTGYSADETRNILNTMYQEDLLAPNDDKYIYLYLLRKVI